MLPSTIISEVQDLIQEPTTSAFSTANRTLRAVNLVYRSFCRRIIRTSQDHFLTSKTFTLVNGTEEYALPPRCDVVRAVTTEDGDEYPQLTRFEQGLRSETGLAALELPIGDYGWFVRGNYLTISPTPTEAVTWTLYYDAWPAEMSYGTAEGGAAASITLMATPTAGVTSTDDDYYIGARLRVTAGISIGDTRTATDYVGSTRVFTTTAFTATPTTASVYAIMCELQDDWMDPIIYNAAATLCFQDGKAEQAMMLKHIGEDAAKEILQGLGGRAHSKAQVQQNSFYRG
jgi:hypothetical protein